MRRTFRRGGKSAPLRQKRKTPAPEGTRVYRRMGEGLGAGGHSTRRRIFNVHGADRFLPDKIIFARWSAGHGGGDVRPFRVPDRSEGQLGGRPETRDIASGCGKV